jgi:WD40 repeat protein
MRVRRASCPKTEFARATRATLSPGARLSARLFNSLPDCGISSPQRGSMLAAESLPHPVHPLSLRSSLTCLAALTAGALSVPAAHELALNLVWTRIADIHGEAGSVESAEISPDNRFVVTGAKFDNSVVLWRTSDGAELWRTYAAAEIERVGWSPDGKFLAAGSEDSLVTLYHAATGAVAGTIPHANPIDSLAWSKRGQWLATGEEEYRNPEGKKVGLIRLFDMPGARSVRTADYGGTINELDFSSDDRLLAAAGHGGVLRLYHTADLSLALEMPCDPNLHLVCVDISPDDRFVATAGFGGTIWIFEITTGKLVKKFNQTGRKIETLTWSQDGLYLFTAGHDTRIFITRLRDILDPLQEEVLPAYRSPPTDNMEYLHISPNGGLLASAHQDGMVRLWVFMNEDPNTNTKRHNWVREQQRRQFGESRPKE